MHQIISAEFNGTAVDIIDRDGKKWLTAEQVGRCLGYSEANASQGIRNLYNRHVDEFTDDDTRQINLIWRDGKPREVRVFSLSGCITLGWLSGTPRARQFREWAKNALQSQITDTDRISITEEEWINVTQPSHDKNQEHERIQKVLAIEERHRAGKAVATAFSSHRGSDLTLAHELGQLKDTVTAQQKLIAGLTRQLLLAKDREIRALRQRMEEDTQRRIDRVILLEAAGTPRAQIVATTGLSFNYVRQIVFRARRDGHLGIDVTPQQGSLALGGAQ